MGEPDRIARRVLVEGAVQGVGFRPFVYRLAREHGLDGTVLNGAAGVEVEVEGARPTVEAFLSALVAEAPPLATVDAVTVMEAPLGHAGFRILASGLEGQGARLLPDLATCEACLRELFEPGDRRFGYPFSSCTACGPRYTVSTGLPWDRPRTTLAGFPLCAACQAEYDDPLDRRFHAQPIACPVCGPRLALLAPDGRPLAVDPLPGAVEALQRGRIVAVRSLGGFQLLVDATDAAAVARLRDRKRRPHKPLAVVAADLAVVRRLALVSAVEAAVLGSPRAPIVLLERAEAGALAANVAPGLGHVGVMLAFTPLHHLLLAAVGRPLVATSANRRGEPLCVDAEEVVARLGEVVDVILTHDRPIARRADDSVVRVVGGQVQVLRRARGYVPDPIDVPWTLRPTVAVGGHMKVALATAAGRRVVLGPHLGDLEGAEVRGIFEGAVREAVGASTAPRIAVDAHPDHPGARFAATLTSSVHRVQHHHAHAAALLAEHGVEGPALVATFDGTGYGLDETIWGGELLVATPSRFERVAHLAPFRLPGGEAAVREPRRSALGWLVSVVGQEEAVARLAPVFDPQALRVLAQILRKEMRSPITTSLGRLFDAVASLLGLCHEATWDGQAAALVEAAAARSTATNPLTPTLTDGVVHFHALAEALLHPQAPVEDLARRFHLGVAEAVCQVARQVALPTVGLSGGCFQSALLTHLCTERLAAAGFEVLVHRHVPPNDGGLAFGQAVVAGLALE